MSATHASISLPAVRDAAPPRLRAQTSGARAERAAMAAMIGIGWITLPLWIVPAAVWCICTGRTLRGCNREANAMSGMEEHQP